LLDLDGQPVDFGRFKGKAVFLNIWATWCGPCVQELPSIARLAGNPTLKDVAFVCVSTDDSAEPVKKFLKGKGWPMTVLRATDCPAVFRTEGIPATFLIGPDGRIAASEVGSAEWDDPKVMDLLKKLASKG
jgi:thiol-disulfide isomerase/thioredoxin